MIRLPLLPLLAFLALVTLVTGWSAPARAHECGQAITVAASTAPADTPAPHPVATAAHDCHETADCCCAGGMAGCATGCAGLLVPSALPGAERTAAPLVLAPAGDSRGVGLALAPALGPPRPSRIA
ncbi:hypothetical protein FBZ89_11839 [Nitrospirillum amazonense]|uniref:Uncharacterized protein n=1 Tax=Nitrospirillum amazonense TaxID=28077 RepID=A0A560EXA0_9PROT|nr:hypothetical protein [Nitrospirillum amazonense]TWB13988.1 hypothetical protein FBZ89_11839 [Nitrospirillum amazonense]